MGRRELVGGAGRDLTTLVASAPGKLILMGEHAVVYGEPALVTAVDLRLRARFETPQDATSGTRGAGSVRLHLPRLRHEERLAWHDLVAYAAAARARWEEFAASPGSVSFGRLRGEDPAHLVKVALGEAVAQAGREPAEGLRLVVESELPIGSGFGSSAALAAAVAGGYLAWRGLRPEPERLEGLASEIERRQHGTPSGVDAATVLRGGVLWAERDADGEPVFSRLSVPAASLSGFHVFDTGTPLDSTGAVVAAVRERWSADPARVGELLREMGRLTRRFRDALLGPAASEEAWEAIRGFQRGLEALGVVPDAARRLVRAVEARGGAAKLSGAGALRAPDRGSPRAGSLLVFHPGAERVEEWEELAGLRRYPLWLGADGFRIERRREERS